MLEDQSRRTAKDLRETQQFFEKEVVLKVQNLEDDSQRLAQELRLYKDEALKVQLLEEDNQPLHRGRKPTRHRGGQGHRGRL